MYKNLMVSDKGTTRMVTIHRPEVLNALNKQTLEELELALYDAGKSVRALIITGAGEKSFVAGADISEMKDLKPIEAERLSRLGHRVLDLIGQLPIPVIAAVNGFALGGGLELALACDFIYASDNASFGLVEAKLGLIPGFGGVARLCRRVGEARAKEMMFSAAILNSEEALRMGLANRVVTSAELLASALLCAEKITSKGPHAIALIKGLVREGQNTGLSVANALEQRSFGFVFGSADHDEGIRAFLEKRSPQFEGR